MAFPRSKLSTSALLVAIGIGTMNAANAAGFRIPEISTVGTGTSNALVANDTEIGALAYNPAAMSFHKGKALNAGILNINYDLEVTPTGSTKTDTTGEDTFFVPNLFFMAEGSNGKSFGLAINAPFGLETGYKAGTFPVFGAISADGLEPSLSRIKMVNVSPNIAFKIDDTSSVSIGLDYFNVKELVFDTQAAFVSGAGRDFGLNFGAGFSIPFDENILFLRASYSLGLYDINDQVGNDLEYTVKNRGIQISAGLSFPLGK